MKKKVSLFLCVVMLVALIPQAAFANADTKCGVVGCTGVYENGICSVCGRYEEISLNDNGYYEISNAGQLYRFAERVNGGETSLCAKLMDDIEVNKNVLDKDGKVIEENIPAFRSWTPIGNEENQYVGTFDGNGKCISGLYFDGKNLTCMGLFGYVYNGTRIQNVGVTESYMRNIESNTGGLIGYAEATTAGGVNVRDCYTNNIFVDGGESTSYLGGLIGRARSTMTKNAAHINVINCYGNLTIRDGESLKLGGIIGYAQASLAGMTSISVKNCYYASTYAKKGIGAKMGRVTDNSVMKTPEEFATGEVTWLLNEKSADGIWKQSIGTDKMPNFKGKKVYSNDVDAYYNPMHDGFDAETGYCDDCGKYTGYKITLKTGKDDKETNKGYVTISNSTETFVEKGEVVTIRAYPMQGYEPDEIKVVRQLTNETEEVTKNGDTYSFVMPDWNVCVEASFSLITEASVTIGEETVNYKKLEDAFAAAAGKTATVTLNGNLNKENPIKVDNENSNITLVGGEYEIESTGNMFEVVGGTLTVKNGTFKTTGGSIFHVSGFVSPTSSGSGLVVIPKEPTKGTVNIEDGTFVSDGSCVNVTAVTAEGRKIAAAGTVNISGGVFTSSNSYAICVSGVTIRSSTDIIGTTYYGNLNVSGGVFESESTYALYAEGLTVDTVTLSGGKFSSIKALYDRLLSDGYAYYCDGKPIKPNEVVKATNVEVAICVHGDYTNSKCDYCGNPCEHVWYNGVCKKCLAVCEHSWSNGRCDNCKMYCTHSWDNNLCEICNVTCDHAAGFENGFCTNCGEYEEIVANSENCYEISNAGQLYRFAEMVNSGETDIHARLMKNIKVNGSVLNDSGNVNETNTWDFRIWTPIGNEENKYIGTFDGNGKSIAGLYFDDDTISYVGLFGFVDSGATVKNVTVKNSYFNGKDCVGGIVGKIEASYEKKATVEMCANMSTVKGKKYVGGIAGSINATSDVHTEVYLRPDHSGSDTLIFADATKASIANCFNKGSVTGDENVGGIAGYASVVYVSSEESLNDPYLLIVPHNGVRETAIENCHNIGKIVGSGRYTGAIAGYALTESSKKHIPITNCYYLENTAENGVATDAENESVLEKTETEFNSGEVTWLLQKNNKNDIWGQLIGDDDYPVFANDENNVNRINLDGSYLFVNSKIALGTESSDGEYVLADNAVGYYIGEKFVDAGKYSVSDGDVIVTVEFNVKMLTGAQVRYGAGVDENGKVKSDNGLRFIATVDRSNFDGEAYGMKIQAEESDNAAEVVADKWQDDTTFTVAITNLVTSNYNRNYTATPFVKVKYDDGTEKTIYGTNSVTRSIYSVSAGLLKNGVSEKDYTLENNVTLYKVLNAYVNMVGIRLNLASDEMSANTTGKGKYTGDVFFDVACEKKENVYTVTVTPITDGFANPVTIAGYWKEFIRINNNNSAVKEMISNESISEEGVLTFDFTVESK